MDREIWIAASHLTENKEEIEKLLEFGPDGIVIKSALFYGSPPCKRKCKFCKNSYRERRFFVDTEKPFTYYTFHERHTCEYLYSEEVVELLSWLKREHPRIGRIASIIGRTREEILEMAKLFERCGASMLEFNSLKYFKHAGILSRGKQTELLPEALREIKNSTSIPLYTKLGADLLSDEIFSKLAGYTDGMTITNGFVVKDPTGELKKTMETLGKDESIVHGDPLWSYVEKYLPMACKHFEHISASGGIYSVERAKRTFELGASSVQLCSAIQFNGPKIIGDMKKMAS